MQLKYLLNRKKEKVKAGATATDLLYLWDDADNVAKILHNAKGWSDKFDNMIDKIDYDAEIHEEFDKQAAQQILDDDPKLAKEIGSLSKTIKLLLEALEEAQNLMTRYVK